MQYVVVYQTVLVSYIVYSALKTDIGELWNRFSNFVFGLRYSFHEDFARATIHNALLHIAYISAE